MKRGIYLTLALLALLAAGCHTTRKTTQPPVQPPTAATDVTPVATPQREYTVMTFTGEVEGIAVNGQLRIAKDSVMWVSVSKLIEVGRAMCTADSLWLHAPMLGREEATDYTALRHVAGTPITFDDMQRIALSDNAEEQIEQLAQRMGISAKVRITGRRQVEHLTFPYPKPSKP